MVYSLDINKFNNIIQKWRIANKPGNSNIDINKLVNETLIAIDSDPFIKEICQAFLMSVSIKAASDPMFHNIGKVNYKGNFGRKEELKKVEYKKG